VNPGYAARPYRCGVFGFHPANLVFRFVLEVAALIAMGAGAYALASGPVAWLVAIAVPVVASVAWATFRAAGDPSASGEAKVDIPGIVRLLVEIDVFAVAVFLAWFASPRFAIILGIAVVIHYALSIDRIRWLLDH
jgi:Protein of unknown function (DUF2568)